jgi:2-oxoglutarate ferredoxin oxidoreductase subunit alpha
MCRISIKIVGASGQGINSIGAILAKGLKRSGYCVFGYREYPSLIKGGHASYQLDLSNQRVQSTHTTVDVLVALNHHGLELNMEELKAEGIVLHVTPGWQFPERHQKLIRERKLRVICIPIDAMLNRLGAKAILSNVLLTALLWSMFGLDVDTLKSLVGEKFSKMKALLELNMRAVDEGYSFLDPQEGKITVELPAPNKDFSSHLLVTGSQAMGLGAVHAGMRVFAGYPITPSSPLLSFIADLENRTQLGMLIRMECGLNIADKILKYDGRPFFYDELLGLILAQLGGAKGGSAAAPISPADSRGPEAERARS